MYINRIYRATLSCVKYMNMEATVNPWLLRMRIAECNATSREYKNDPLLDH
jgi:hypothetical protein